LKNSLHVEASFRVYVEMLDLNKMSVNSDQKMIELTSPVTVTGPPACSWVKVMTP
jgi:hypothetical protein